MKKEKYVLVIGGASLDNSYMQREDGSYPKEPDITVPGGKAANQAVALGRAGANVKIITRLSDMPSEQANTKRIVENLKQNGVDVSNIEFDPNIQNDISHIKIMLGGENDISRTVGAIDSFSPAMVDRYAEVIKGASFVVAQMKAPKEFSIKLINFCYENHVPLVVTPCRPDKLKYADKENQDLIEKITYVTANRHEYETMFLPLSVEETVALYPNKLVVTLGKDGSVYHDGKKAVKLPAFDTEVVDTTGAGDTLNGNMVAALMRGDSLHDAIILGMMASSLKVREPSAQKGMPYLNELLKLKKEIENNKN